jgi:hypothetical protein
MKNAQDAVEGAFERVTHFKIHCVRVKANHPWSTADVTQIRCSQRS